WVVPFSRLRAHPAAGSEVQEGLLGRRGHQDDQGLRRTDRREGYPEDHRVPGRNLLVENRSIDRVLEQVGFGPEDTPTPPWRHASIDPHKTPFGTRPEVGARKADVSNRRIGGKSAVGPIPVTRPKNEQSEAIPSSVEGDFRPLSGLRINEA